MVNLYTAEGGNLKEGGGDGEGRQRKKPDLLLMPACVPWCSVSQFEWENPQRRPRVRGTQASELDIYGEWTEFLSTGTDSNGQIGGNKAVGAGKKTEDDSSSFNVSFTTNSSIKIIKFYFFQSFWEKERFILAEIPMGCWSDSLTHPAMKATLLHTGSSGFPVMEVCLLRTTVIQQYFLSICVFANAYVCNWSKNTNLLPSSGLS